MRNSRNVRARFVASNSEGQPLTREEERSLNLFVTLASGDQEPAEQQPLSGSGGGGSSGASSGATDVAIKAPLASTVPQDVSHAVLQIIQKGTECDPKTDLPQLEGAMLAAEQAFMGTIIAEDLAGVTSSRATCAAQHIPTWQPVFASAGGFPRLLFIPVFELFDLSKSHTEGRINIVTELGPFVTHFLGTCSWDTPDTLAYNINTLRINAGDNKLIEVGLPHFMQLNNMLKFFAIKEGEEGWACARSKLGGTMLLTPNPSAGDKYVGSW